MKKKLSRTLTHRTKLSAEQYARVLASAGHGESHAFDPKTYVKSLPRIRGLAKARKKCPKYILYSDQLGRRAYVADWKLAELTESEAPITFQKNHALVFYHGFDSVEAKRKHYAKATNLKLSYHNI